MEKGQEVSANQSSKLVLARIQDGNCQYKTVTSANHRFQFEKRCQLFVGIHNELFDPMGRVTAVLLLAGCAPTDPVYIVDTSLLIIAHLFLLRAIDSFKSSPRRVSHNPDRSPLGISS